MPSISYALNVVASKLPIFRFVARLGNSDVIGVEQEYTLRPARRKRAKDVVEVNYETAKSRKSVRPGYISVTEAVKKFKMPRNKVYELCSSKAIEAFQEGKKGQWWIKEDSLAAYSRSLKQ